MVQHDHIGQTKMYTSLQIRSGCLSGWGNKSQRWKQEIERVIFVDKWLRNVVNILNHAKPSFTKPH